MVEYTPNYNLKKPDEDVFYDVNDQNWNMEIIDVKLKEVENAAKNITVPVTSVNNKTGAVSLAASDVGAVPTTRKVNNKVLSTDITLSAADIKTTSGETVDASLDKKTNKNDYVANNAFATTTGTSTAYTITLNPAPTAYADGMQVTILPHVDCGANPTLNVNGLGALTILKQDGSAIGTGDIKANKPLSLVRVGSNFFIRSSGGSNIKSIQKGSISTYEVRDLEIIVPISPVDLKSSIVRIQIRFFPGSSGSRNAEIDTAVYFKTSSSIGIRNYKMNGYAIVYWEVIEFNNVKSLQSGVTSSTSVAITPLTSEKYLIFYSSCYDTFNDGYDLNVYTGNFIIGSYISNNKYLNFNYTYRSGDTTRYIYWQLIEFK